MCRLDSWDDASFWSMVSEEKADERRGTEKKYCYIILRTRKLSNTYGFFFFDKFVFFIRTPNSQIQIKQIKLSDLVHTGQLVSIFLNRKVFYQCMKIQEKLSSLNYYLYTG